MLLNIELSNKDCYDDREVQNKDCIDRPNIVYLNVHGHWNDFVQQQMISSFGMMKKCLLYDILFLLLNPRGLKSANCCARIIFHFLLVSLLI